MAFLAGWTYRKKITIDELKVDADLVDFPVLVKLTSTNFTFTKALSTGFDIRFTSVDGITLLKYERERHNATGLVAEYWVKIPAVSGTVNTEFYIYHGNAVAADGADPTVVWDTNFQAVYHLKEASNTTVYDSTINARNSITNLFSSIEAKINKGGSFDGITNYIERTSGDTGIVDAWTIEFFINYNTLGTNVQVALRDPVSNANFILLNLYGNKQEVRIYNVVGNAYVKDWTGNTIFSAATWYHVTITWIGNTTLKIFINSVEDIPYTKYADLTETMTNTNRTISIAGWNNSSFTDGKLDEVRISNIERTVAWIKASYNSGNDSLVSYGAEETLAATGNFFLMFS